jgi:hypothetical protein
MLGFAYTKSPGLRATRHRVRLCSSRRQLELIAKLPDDRPAVLCRNSAELLTGEVPAHRHPNPNPNRHLWDSVASVEECQRAVEVAQRAMCRCCDNDGDHGKLFPPHVPEASHFLGDDGFALFSELRQRVALQAAVACGPVVPAASLLSWISGSAATIDTGGASDADAGGTSGAGGELRSYDWRRDATHGTFAPHVDQANQSDYDISALLYLSTFGVDFHGGLFAFNDTDCDRLVEPKAGRLLAFSSGFENLHQVRPVHSGERLVLSVWFRREGGSRLGLQGNKP